METRRRTAIAGGDNISVMTQILQYSLVGASEVLASIGQLEFFYDQVCTWPLLSIASPCTAHCTVARVFVLFVQQRMLWVSVLPSLPSNYFNYSATISPPQPLQATKPELKGRHLVREGSFLRMQWLHPQPQCPEEYWGPGVVHNQAPSSGTLRSSACMQAPDVMRSVCLALNLVATALGGYFSAFLMSITDNYTTWLNNLDDPKTSHLDQYFFLLATFMLVNTVAFVGVAYGYKYKVIKHRAPLPLVGGQQPHAVRQAATAAPGALRLPPFQFVLCFPKYLYSIDRLDAY